VVREGFLCPSLHAIDGYGRLPSIPSSVFAPAVVYYDHMLLTGDAPGKYAVPFGGGIVVRDMVHGELSTRIRIQAGQQVEKSRSVHAPSEQCDDALSAGGVSSICQLKWTCGMST